MAHQFLDSQAPKRRRKSRLDPHFLIIANLFLNQHKAGLSFIEMADLVHQKTKVRVDATTLWRFIQRHPNLKLL